jgi:hypothetical protein
MSGSGATFTTTVGSEDSATPLVRLTPRRESSMLRTELDDAKKRLRRKNK